MHIVRIGWCWSIPNYRLVGLQKHCTCHSNHFRHWTSCKFSTEIFKCKTVFCMHLSCTFLKKCLHWIFDWFLDLQASRIQRTTLGTTTSWGESPWFLWRSIARIGSHHWIAGRHKPWCKSIRPKLRRITQNYSRKIDSLDLFFTIKFIQQHTYVFIVCRKCMLSSSIIYFLCNCFSFWLQLE